MPFTKRSDGSLEIKATRTLARTLFAVSLLLVPLLCVLMLGYFSLSSHIWTWPPSQILLIAVFGVFLNPLVWGSFAFVVNFAMYWNGTTLLYREGSFVVSKRLAWGRGLAHRKDLNGLPALSVSVQRYARDDVDPGWRTSFRPRVVVQSGESRVMAIGEGLSLVEAAGLVAAMDALVEASAGRVEQALQPDSAPGEVDSAGKA